MSKGGANPTEFDQTANARSQPIGVRLRALRFVVERETAQTVS